MAGLPEATARLEKAIESARTAGGADGATAQLELLHQIHSLLSSAAEDEVKASQGAIEAALLSATLMGPAPPVSRLSVVVLATIYRRGARTSLYTTVGQLVSWLNNKSSPASSVPARCATVQLLGGLCAAHGPAMVSLCLDAVLLLTKLTKPPEPAPIRAAAWAALAQAYPGTGGVPKAAQEEGIRSLKQGMGERGAAAELRPACLRAAPALVLHAESLWSGDVFDVCCGAITKALDDPSNAVRAAAALSLSEVLLAALARPAGFGGGKGPRRGTGGLKLSLPAKRAEASTPLEAVAAVLVTPFLKAGASRDLRMGLARAAVGLLHGMRRAEFERHAEFLLTCFLNMAAAPVEAAKPAGRAGGGAAAECVTHVLRAGMGERLSERGQHMMAVTLAAQVSSRSCAEPVLLVGLKELSLLLLQLREVAADARDALLQGERPLLSLATSGPRSVRLCACQCLWSLVLAFPSQLAPMLNLSLNRLRASAAAPPARDSDALLSEAQAVAILVASSSRTPFGAPPALTNGCLNAASELVSSGDEAKAGAGWVVLTSLLSLSPGWLSAKPRLAKLYAMLKAGMGAEVLEVSFKKREAVEGQLRARAHAMQALSRFLEVMPESVAAAFVKPITTALLPPNIALLASCREHAPKLMNPGFRQAYLLFRARLYLTLVALPSSALTAKVLNVVMPLVVADIVEPANTHAATCTALSTLLDPLDNPLAPPPDDEPLPPGIAPPDPLRVAAADEAEGCCAWLGEIRGGQAADAEVACLDAAVALFGAVFRLQSSDVRAQLLSHLGTAASKASRDSATSKPSSAVAFFAAATADASRDDRPSPLTNICAALLSSVQRLAQRPARSILRPELTPAFGAVLAPCLADADGSVRRAAAQAVGLLGQLLGDPYTESFLSVASAALTDPKAKDDTRAAHALALAHLFSPPPGLAGCRPPSVSRARVCVQLLSSLLPSAGAPPPPPALVEWSLHSLARVATHLVSDFKPMVGATLSALSAACLAPAAPQSLRSAVATMRLCTALAAAIAPALASGGGKAGQPQAMLYRCRVLIAAASRAHGHGGLSHAHHTRGGGPDLVAAEELRFERLLLTLPSAASPVAATPPHALHSALVHGLASPEAALRRAALEALCEIGAATVQATHSAAASTYALSRKELGRVSGALLHLMDHEPDPSSLDAAKHLLLQLLHAHGPTSPAFWLSALADTVQEGKTSQEAKGAVAGSFGGGDSGDESDDTGGWDQSASGLPQGGDDEDEEDMRKRQKEAQVEAEESLKWARTLPRWQTRLFAAEAARRLLFVVSQPEHFSLELARASHTAGGPGADHTGGGPDLLVHSLPTMVGVAFTVATARIDAMRPAGVLMLLDIVERFGAARDPDFEGHLLLEQSHAQIGAALRPCFAPDAAPGLTASGCALLSRYLLAITSTADNLTVDPIAARKLLSLLTKIVTPSGLAAIDYPSLSDAAATVVRAAALRAAATLQQAAAAEPDSRAQLALLLQPSLPELRSCWLALLRDWCALSATSGRSARGYLPHIHTSAAAAAAREHLAHAWPSVLDASLSLIGSEAWDRSRPSAPPPSPSPADTADAALTSEDPVEVSALRPVQSSTAASDLDLLLGLCVHTLAGAEARCAQGGEGDLCGEEATMCVASLPKLLHPSILRPTALPAASLLLLLQLLLRIAESGSAPAPMCSAIAHLTVHLAPRLGGYTSSAPTPAGGGGGGPLPEGFAEGRQLIVALQRLAAVPAMRAMPGLREPGSMAVPGGRDIAPAGAPDLALAIRALSLLPASLPPTDRLEWLPTALTVTLRAAAAGEAHALRDECAASVAALVGFCEPPAGDADAMLLERSSGAAATKGRLRAAAGGTALGYLAGAEEGSPAAELLLSLALRIAGGLPVTAPAGAAVHCQIQAALRRMLRPGGGPAQRAAHATLLSFLAGCKDGDPAGLASYLRALLPDVAACFYAGEENDRVGAVKVLLLACTLAPPEATAPIFSLTLPTLVHGMRTEADGPPSPADAELAPLCHTALTALAGRAPEAFRAAVAAFSPATRSRMEAAVREAAAKKQAAAAPAPTSAATVAQPKIALKMDFGNFGK